MKQIISGKKYDTNTAKEVGYWSNNLSYRDFRYCEEYLYRKKTGEFFLHGIGGAMTKYCQPCGDMRSGGEKITPMTEHEAKTWAEEHLIADEYEEVFGEVEE